MDITLQQECANIKSSILSPFVNLNANTYLYVAVWNTPLFCLLDLQKNWETLMGQSRVFHIAITETTTMIWVTKAGPWSR